MLKSLLVKHTDSQKISLENINIDASVGTVQRVAR